MVIHGCESCVRYASYPEKERNKYHWCGCNGKGERSKEECDTPFRECWMSRESAVKFLRDNGHTAEADLIEKGGELY